VQVARLAARGATALGGRTLVLTTTLRALRTIGDALRQQLELLDGAPRPEVLVQGELPKRVLMDRFREGDAHGRSGCVLVASASFWEGFDAPGDALQLVVIDKLPFPPPNDPLVEARVKRLESEGRNPFAEYFVAEAAVSLKQGAGRLIRSETDRGLLVICDPRMAGMNYGRRLREALPPMTRVLNEDEALAWLDSLSAASLPF
jgi:ATP-dependent DNA helicase DinG